MSSPLVRSLRCPRAFAPRTGAMLRQKAGYVRGRAPKNDVGAAESVFALAALTLAVLGPSAWILAHLDHYKSRG